MSIWNKLHENADYTNYQDKPLTWEDIEAIGFGYHWTNNYVLIDDPEDDPEEARYEMIVFEQDAHNFVDDRKGRIGFDYPGRLWVDSKVISFWEHPPQNKIQKVLEDIEEAVLLKTDYEVDFDDSDWVIEVFNKPSDLNSEFVPLSTYLPQPVDPEPTEHEKSPLLKKKKKVIKNFKDITPVWKQRIRQEKLILNYTDFLSEDINQIITPWGKKLTYQDSEAIPFAWITGYEKYFQLGETIEPHLEIGHWGGKHEDMLNFEYGVSRYDGRIWTKNHIIGFWDYPSPTMLKIIVKELERKLKIKIEGNEYLVEIFENHNKPSKFIPLAKYGSQEYLNPPRIPHEISPLKKPKLVNKNRRKRKSLAIRKFQPYD
jgi:hypothetical protein